jgi:hypothetical protein
MTGKELRMAEQKIMHDIGVALDRLQQRMDAAEAWYAARDAPPLSARERADIRWRRVN